MLYLTLVAPRQQLEYRSWCFFTPFLQGQLDNPKFFYSVRKFLTGSSITPSRTLACGSAIPECTHNDGERKRRGGIAQQNLVFIWHLRLVNIDDFGTCVHGNVRGCRGESNRIPSTYKVSEFARFSLSPFAGVGGWGEGWGMHVVNTRAPVTWERGAWRAHWLRYIS